VSRDSRIGRSNKGEGWELVAELVELIVFVRVMVRTDSEVVWSVRGSVEEFGADHGLPANDSVSPVREGGIGGNGKELEGPHKVRRKCMLIQLGKIAVGRVLINRLSKTE